MQLSPHREGRWHRLQLVDDFGDRSPLLDVIHQVEDPIEVVGPHHHVDPWGALPHQVPVLLRRTSPDHQQHLGVQVLDRLELAQVAVHPVVGVLPDGASVDVHHVGALDPGGRCHPVHLEQAGDPLRVVLVHLAPEGTDEVALTATRRASTSRLA